ncbi:hypothetical protein GYMLUDRAFT_580371 [Collybiopsis luxurians FD-317 M1]|uniref:Uncharacterized protein n=1 Tax=Collybiopsis luxurians FD-317 M1 TaxID=944289 RepID=A0A0D0BC82_9AGAR|nr:hypothetical protein GYMLUDRAFT_580371 [Collybiopsis luxurians FD-317 M1]
MYDEANLSAEVCPILPIPVPVQEVAIVDRKLLRKTKSTKPDNYNSKKNSLIHPFRVGKYSRRLSTRLPVSTCVQCSKYTCCNCNLKRSSLTIGDLLIMDSTCLHTDTPKSHQFFIKNICGTKNVPVCRLFDLIFSCTIYLHASIRILRKLKKFKGAGKYVEAHKYTGSTTEYHGGTVLGIFCSQVQVPFVTGAFEHLRLAHFCLVLFLFTLHIPTICMQLPHGRVWLHAPPTSKTMFLSWLNPAYARHTPPK